MRHNYDILETFPDGSSVWRASVPGRVNAQRAIQDLAKHSPNEFVAIDINGGPFVAFRVSRGKS